MIVEASNVARNTSKPIDMAAERIKADRKEQEDIVQEPHTKDSEKAPEEILQQIKSLTEEGSYSVRFEKDERADQLVVKIVDRATDKMIRQVPAEEVLELNAVLNDLRGNIVNTKS